MTALAGRVAAPEARAQLHALAALLDGYEEPLGCDDAPTELEQAISASIEADDETALLSAMRELAAIDRAAVRSVNWSAASSG